MHDSIGRPATDRITDFKGIVVGRVEYLTGCNQLLIQPTMEKKATSFPEARWFDAQRCTVSSKGKVVIENGSTPGFDVPAPIR